MLWNDYFRLETIHSSTLFSMTWVQTKNTCQLFSWVPKFRPWRCANCFWFTWSTVWALRWLGSWFCCRTSPLRWYPVGIQGHRHPSQWHYFPHYWSWWSKCSWSQRHDPAWKSLSAGAKYKDSYCHFLIDQVSNLQFSFYLSFRLIIVALCSGGWYHISANCFVTKDHTQ